MKTEKIKMSFGKLLLFFLPVLLLISSCTKSDDPIDQNQYAGVWFRVDSVKVDEAYRKYKELLILTDSNTFVNKFLSYKKVGNTYVDSIRCSGKYQFNKSSISMTINEVWDYKNLTSGNQPTIYTDLSIETLDEFLLRTNNPRNKRMSFIVDDNLMHVIFDEYVLGDVKYSADTVVYKNYRL